MMDIESELASEAGDSVCIVLTTVTSFFILGLLFIVWTLFGYRKVQQPLAVGQDIVYVKFYNVCILLNRLLVMK